MRKVDRKVIIRHESGWLIVYESGFPSCNYSVFKAMEWGPSEKLPRSGIAYCGSLENALNHLFSQLVIENIEMNGDYHANLKDLRKAVDKTRQDLNDLLKIQRDQQSTNHKSIEKENKRSRLQTTLEKLDEIT